MPSSSPDDASERFARTGTDRSATSSRRRRKCRSRNLRHRTSRRALCPQRPQRGARALLRRVVFRGPRGLQEGVGMNRSGLAGFAQRIQNFERHSRSRGRTCTLTLGTRSNRSRVHRQEQAEAHNLRDGRGLRRLQIDGAGVFQLHRPVRDDAQALALGGGRRILNHEEPLAIRCDVVIRRCRTGHAAG
jgi:hypothetical protein